MHRLWNPISLALITLTLSRVGMATEPTPAPAPGTITTVAGTGQAGFSGDDGPATKARLSFLTLVALDGAGNLFISDAPPGDGANQRVRKVSPDGLITTVAGTGRLGFSGDGGPATAAELNWPRGLAVDRAGNLFIADHFNHRIRKVSPEGIITTVAGSGSDAPAKGVSAGDGGLATEARLNGPFGLAMDGTGNLFFSEQGDTFGTNLGYRVRKVDSKGIITTVAGSDRRGFAGDGGPATAALLNAPGGLAVDSAGNLFIGDRINNRVRKVDANGIITTVVGNGTTRYGGDGGPATTTGVDGPHGMAVDAAGNLLITVRDRVLKVFGVAAPGLIAGQPFPSP